jgi:serine/threonine protein kinase
MGISRGYVVGPHSHPPGPSLTRFQVNILINRDGHACLTDFSLVAIISDQQTFLSSHIEGGSTQWMSPELLDPEMFGFKKSRPTKESDCYALGMVIYEVLSGRTPFTLSKASVVIQRVLDGERPERPPGSDGKLFAGRIWRVVRRCWKPRPRDRISAKVVLLGLEGRLCPLTLGLLSKMDGGADTDSDGQSDTTASDSGMFYSSHPRLIFNYPRATIESLISQGDNGFQVLRSRPSRRPSPTVMTQPTSSPQLDGSRRERVLRLAQKRSESVIRKLRGS